MRPRFHLAPWLVLLSVPAGPLRAAGDGEAADAILTGDRFRMAMPLPARMPPFRDEVSLPWGKAEASEYQATDSRTGVIYIFGTYAWRRPPRPIDGRRLRSSRAYFLRHRGCSARDLRNPRLADGRGKVWPQAVFEGSCEGGDAFRVAFVVAGGTVFRFHTAVQATLVRHQPVDLGKALEQLVAGFTVTE